MTDIVSFSLVREMTQLPNRNDIIPIQRAFPASLPRKRGNDLGKTQTWDLERNGAPQNRRELAELHDADNFPQYFITIQCGIQVSPFSINNCFISNLHKKMHSCTVSKRQSRFPKSVPALSQLVPKLVTVNVIHTLHRMYNCTLYNTPTHIVHCTTHPHTWARDSVQPP